MGDYDPVELALRLQLAEVIAERDRLRAVVDVLREVAVAVVGANNASPYEQGNAAAWKHVLHAVRQLDGSEVMGETDSTGRVAPHESDGAEEFSPHGAPDPAIGGSAPPSTPAPHLCRWCHEPIVYMNDQWVHEGPQLGKYATHQRACEPDMQSMLAEPEDELDDPLLPFMSLDPQPFRDWRDFTERVARPIVESDGDPTEVAESMALYRLASPFYICTALVMAANRIDEESPDSKVQATWNAISQLADEQTGIATAT